MFVFSHTTLTWTKGLLLLLVISVADCAMDVPRSQLADLPYRLPLSGYRRLIEPP